MKSKIFLVALAFSAYCCSPKGDGTVYEIEIEGGRKMTVSLYSASNTNLATVPLSSLVESFEIVQLETREDAFFNPRFTTVTDKYILVTARDAPYLLFDRLGKFIGQIGSMGRGPGEYAITPYDAIIDDKNELIYLSPFIGDRILVYNTSGQFVKDIVSPQRLQLSKIFLSLSKENRYPKH